MSQPEAPRWPIYPGEHERLPELVLELHEPFDGRGQQMSRPASARVLISPLRVLWTSNPDRLRAWAEALLVLADDLEEAHGLGMPGQQELLDP